MSALFNRQVGIYDVLGKHAVGLSLGMAGLVFLADLFTPLGVASGVPYSLAILLSLNAPSRRYVLAFAIVCSILTLSDFYLGPGRGGSELWKVLTNRFLAIVMIWITLTLGMMRKHADQRRQAAEAQTLLHLAYICSVQVPCGSGSGIKFTYSVLSPVSAPIPLGFASTLRDRPRLLHSQTLLASFLSWLQREACPKIFSHASCFSSIGNSTPLNLI